MVGISLGNRCSTAIWATENNYRLSKANGYKTCPFDLCVTNYRGIIDCINDDFRDLTNPQYLSLEYYGSQNIHVDNSHQNELLIYNKKYNFCFNHESPYHGNLFITQQWENGPNHFTDNNFKLFIERYNARIQNFRNYLNECTGHDQILFLIKWDSGQEPNDNCNELRNVLNSKYPNLTFTIFIIQ